MLRNWPIRSKLVVILIVPLAALAVLSAIQVRGDVDNVRAADRIEALANFSIKANDLVHALQVERYASNAYLGSNYSFPALGEAVMSSRQPVDEALRVYWAGEQTLPDSARDELGGTLSAITEQLNQLPEQRRQFDAHQTQVATTIAFYDAGVKNLLRLNAQVASGSTDARLASAATTLAGISQAKEQAAQQRGAVAQMLSLRSATSQTIWQLEATAGAEDAWIEQFRTTATADQQEVFNSTVGRSKTNVDQVRERIIAALTAGDPITMGPRDWTQLADAKIAQMREVERRVASDLGVTSRTISDDASRGALIGSVGVAGILIVSIVISLLVASPMINQLRRLRRGALDVATDRLPAVVERLHRGEPVDIDAEAFPVPSTSKDEIGQLADAFATVHEVAVRTAVEQAAMRKSIGDTFLNLARRSQALIHRQLKIIDALERKETDPDELEELFRLDHLATRMRRHAEDLIVLSGSKPARGWRRPVPIKDIVRGAVAEVEDYTRVKVLPITGGAVSGHAVGDVIHMFAELIENATSFSPPHTPVQVSGHPVSNGFVVEIEDRGLGMSQEEIDALNHRLANPPPFDLSTSERLGLFVVGRLAQRHAVQVRLRPSPYGGTMAIVLLPEALLRETEEKTDTADPREFAAVGAASAGTQNGSLAALNGLGEVPNDLAELDASLPSSNGRWSGTPGTPGTPNISGDEHDGGADAAQAKLGTAPATGPRTDETLIDDLPVFATARSSWFVADRPRGGRPADEDGTGSPAVPGELTSPMPLAELTAGEEEAAGAGEQSSADDSDNWGTGRYGRADQDPSDGRYRSSGSLFSPPANGSLFSAPPDTGQFTSYRPGGYDNGAFGGSGGTEGDARGARGNMGYGNDGYGDDGYGDDANRPSDYPTSEVNRASFTPPNGLPGSGSAGPGFALGRPADPPDGALEPLPGRDLPSRRRGPRGTGGDQPASARHGSEEGYREPRADRGGEFGRPPRDGGQYETPRDGGYGDRGYGDRGRSAGYSAPGYTAATSPGDAGAGDGYRAGNWAPPGADAGRTGRMAREADPGPAATGLPANDEDPLGELDELGLPKRRRRANLAPQLRRENTDASRSAVAAGPRSPEEIRSMMSSFQANFGRGIEDGTLSNDGDDVRKVT